MLKKLMLLTAVFTAVTICAAVNNLFKFVPRSSICIGYFNVEKLIKHPEVTKQLKKPEVENFIKQLNNTIGFSLQDIKDALIISDKDNKGGYYLLQLKKPVDLKKLFEALNKNPQMQSSNLIGRYAVKNINGKKVYLVTAIDKLGKTNKIEVTELAPGIILNAINTNYVSYTNEVKGINQELAKSIKKIPNSKLAWLVGKTPENPLQIKNVTLSFDLIGPKLTTQHYICNLDFANAQEAVHVSKLLPMYFNMGLGIIFSAAPTLGAQIAKCLKIKTINNQVNLTITISKNLFGEILKYLNENQELLKNLIPRKSVLQTDSKGL